MKQIQAEMKQPFIILASQILILKSECCKKLIITLSIVLLAALILVFLICLFFANRSIKTNRRRLEQTKINLLPTRHMSLKTPLTTINTNIDLLMTHGDSTINEEKSG